MNDQMVQLGLINVTLVTRNSRVQRFSSYMNMFIQGLTLLNVKHATDGSPEMRV